MTVQFDQVLREYEIFQPPPEVRRRALWARRLTARAAAVASVASSARRLAWPSAPGAWRPAVAGVEAWAFTPVEREVLAPVAEASAGRIELIDAADPLGLWPRRDFARARVRAGAGLLTRLFGPRRHVIADWGAETRDAISALAEVELHRRRLRQRPAAVIVANHYSPRQAALLTAARDAGVRTLYVQHAAVGGIEGPLSTDVSLLHGWDAVRKYLAQGEPAGEVVVLGSVKVEEARRCAPGASTSVGLAPGLFSQPEALERLARALCASGGPGVLELRPHPADRRVSAWRAVAERIGARYCDSRSVPTAEFLARQSRLFGGDSNIILESLALGIPASLIDEAAAGLDQYGMVRAGLAVPPGGERSSAAAVRLRRYVHPAPAGGAAAVAAAIALDPQALDSGRLPLRRRRVCGDISVWAPWDRVGLPPSPLLEAPPQSGSTREQACPID
ncbi:hypothetical protein ACFODL_16310 [Phenylobacterium terrae]|uniref:Uncharacterized protein n=1 Tax=Phenylobacterium terrae TaxID=2665495 RepID=A0ABW4N2X4_9CAUL